MLKVLQVMFAGLGFIAAGSVAWAQNYPSRPVQIIIPYPPGGSTDGLIRALADRLSEQWGQPVVVDHKGGANETIGAAALASAKPDGHTLLVATDATTMHNATLFKRLPYKTETAFAPITRIAIGRMALIVPANSKVNSLADFISAAKSRPGMLNYGSASLGGISHISMAWFAHRQGISMNHVPYRGAGPMIADVIGGTTDAAITSIPAIVGPISSGQVRAIAMSGDARAAALPDVPTFKEQGVEDPDALYNLSLLAPANTPPQVVDRISRDVAQIIKSDAFKSRHLTPFAFEVIGDSPAEFSAYLAKERPLQTERVLRSGAVLD